MIRVRPWEDLAAMAVFNRLDVHDHIEAELVQGVTYTALGLFADWRTAQAQGPVSLVATTGPADRPFAILALVCVLFIKEVPLRTTLADAVEDNDPVNLTDAGSEGEPSVSRLVGSATAPVPASREAG